MHAPKHACRQLARLHPQLRLAWDGASNSFAVVQLYHVNDCGDIDDPSTFREYWGVTTVTNSEGLPERRRAARGPIFARNGSTRPDWNTSMRHPIFVATLNESYQYPNGDRMSTADIYSGKFITAIEYWLRPITTRILDDRVKRGKEYKQLADDISGEMTDELWFEANKPDATSMPIAKKHAKEGTGRLDAYREGHHRKLEDAFLPPAVPKGAR